MVNENKRLFLYLKFMRKCIEETNNSNEPEFLQKFGNKIPTLEDKKGHFKQIIIDNTRY